MENFIVMIKNILRIPNNLHIPNIIKLVITWKFVQCSLSKMLK